MYEIKWDSRAVWPSVEGNGLQHRLSLVQIQAPPPFTNNYSKIIA